MNRVLPSPSNSDVHICESHPVKKDKHTSSDEEKQQETPVMTDCEDKKNEKRWRGLEDEKK